MSSGIDTKKRVLIVGATSNLGARVARRLLAAGHAVRALTRSPGSAAALELQRLGAEVTRADLTDPASLEPVFSGVQSVIAAAHGFPGRGSNNPRTVDDRGNRALIDAAKRHGVSRLIFVSILGVRRDHPVEFFRIKWQIEEYLRASGLAYGVVRAGAFMESWATMVGEPLLKTGRTTIFGRGNNPVNFVSAEDVAEYVLIALQDSRASNRVLEIGGPENLTLNQVARVFEDVSGRTGKKSHVPLPLLRVMSVVTKPLVPALSRAMSAGVYMDTADQRFDMNETLREFPMRLTRLQEFVQRTYAAD